MKRVEALEMFFEFAMGSTLVLAIAKDWLLVHESWHYSLASDLSWALSLMAIATFIFLRLYNFDLSTNPELRKQQEEQLKAILKRSITMASIIIILYFVEDVACLVYRLYTAGDWLQPAARALGLAAIFIIATRVFPKKEKDETLPR